MREIKEVRPGKNSRDFSRWPEEANNAKANRCFVVFYGSDFNLKVRYLHIFQLSLTMKNVMGFTHGWVKIAMPKTKQKVKTQLQH